MYKNLCNSKKCRLLSDLKSTFNLPPYYLTDNDILHKIHKQVISSMEYPLLTGFVVPPLITKIPLTKKLL